ncbi:ArsA family ATPase [Rhodococcus sp. SGAir0479]|uniref:ArsA family ATPase n=1 Tax=Rhodococcus sp. SGAir0479 TaxID=2567884 RepID=UPI0020C7FCB6|nr:ArsA-related P-loop ATPase [Rhodococcus sp. SGAir0479]
MSGPGTRVLLVVGKGGAGRTTVAAATAAGFAAAGRRVLLASLDQAHGLPDVLGLPVESGTETRLAPGLDAVRIDTLALLEERYRGLVSLLALGGAHDHGAQFTNLAPEELTGVPGVEELLGLREILRFVDEDRWDVVVVDCPPTADALRAFAVPETVTGYVERVWPRHRRVVAATAADARLSFAVALLDRVVDGAAAVASLLTDRARTGLRVVVSAEEVGLAETRRLLSAAALAELRVADIVVNNLLPQQHSSAATGGVADWYRARSAAQEAALAGLRTVAGAAPILSVAARPVGPVGLVALGELAPEVRVGDGSAPVDEPPVRVALESGAGGVDSVYAMRMTLPLVDPETLTLGRVEDDLLVGADGRRRRVRLASVLRRCTVRDADFDGADLVVRFVPDPAVWPQ